MPAALNKKRFKALSGGRKRVEGRGGCWGVGGKVLGGKRKGGSSALNRMDPKGERKFTRLRQSTLHPFGGVGKFMCQGVHFGVQAYTPQRTCNTVSG